MIYLKKIIENPAHALVAALIIVFSAFSLLTSYAAVAYFLDGQINGLFPLLVATLSLTGALLFARELYHEIS